MIGAGDANIAGGFADLIIGAKTDGQARVRVSSITGEIAIEMLNWTYWAMTIYRAKTPPATQGR